MILCKVLDTLGDFAHKRGYVKLSGSAYLLSLSAAHRSFDRHAKKFITVGCTECSWTYSGIDPNYAAARWDHHDCEEFSEGE